MAPSRPDRTVECPHCGAPLALRPGRLWAICGFCDSSVRLTWDSGEPRAELVAEVPADVVEEVKRLLQMGDRNGALDSYARLAGIEPAEAELALAAIQGAIRFQPPLSRGGIVMLAVAAAASAAAGLSGVWLAAGGQTMSGVALLAGAVLLARLNWRPLFGSLGVTWLYYSGQPAAATVLKCWHVAEVRRGKATHFEVTRLLLRVQPENAPGFQAEASCIVGEQSRAKFSPGAVVDVKYGRRGEVVVTGASRSPAPGEAGDHAGDR